ncbi:MAG: enolase C-terminal domain-like protein [Sphaerochaetaceae bacterium]
MFDVHVTNTSVSFCSERNRVPLKFGHEITTLFTICRAYCIVENNAGITCQGVGETPVAVAWTWPSVLSYKAREARMIEFINLLCDEWKHFEKTGHPMEIGYRFILERLHPLLNKANLMHSDEEKMPYLAALVCNASFDIALFDAYSTLNGIKAFDCFNSKYMNHDLSWYYEGEDASDFIGKYPEEFMVPRDEVPEKLIVWHLVGGTDPISEDELKGNEPDDGYPVLLRDWIKRDGLKCLKIKLRGNDEFWDYERIVRVGEIAVETGVEHLTADFNCTVHEADYVCRILDKLKSEHKNLFEMILYIEQPFPYDMEKNPIDVHAVAERKLLMMDESAHDWHYVKLGINLGWTGVALKTCKTITGAVLMLCYARHHGMKIMVQDLTNPKLAIIPHVLLAANSGTIMGVEANSMQFCPEASLDEARIHPGLFRRKNGYLDLSSIGNTGFGYRLDEIEDAR